jgi:hypothetical protein
MTTIFNVYRDDDFQSNMNIASDNIPLLRTIIDNITLLLSNNATIRHSYICVLRQTTLDCSPATQREDEILVDFFQHRFPEVRLMVMSHQLLACMHRQSVPRRLYLNRQLAVALQAYNPLVISIYMDNAIMLVVASIFHELAHLLWTDVHSPKIGTPPHFIFPPHNYWKDGRLIPAPEWGESGFVVEGRLFEGILSPVYDGGFQGDFSRIGKLSMRRDAGGLYNEASFRLRTSISESFSVFPVAHELFRLAIGQSEIADKIANLLFRPSTFRPAFTLNHVTAVLPHHNNPINYPDNFATNRNGQWLFLARSRFSESWIPYEHGDLRVTTPLCKMAMEKEVVVA